MSTAPEPVAAAGALCFRVVDDGPEVLLVHRPEHDDWTLPKGKVEPGELLPRTAVREVAEETGQRVTLMAPLGTVGYALPNGRDKVVSYWAAEVDASTKVRFSRNAEVDRLEWLPLDAVGDRLSYRHDESVVETFRTRWDDGCARTFPIISVRHGKAIAHGDWKGKPDRLRPLQKRGVQQARLLAPAVAAFGPERIISSTAVRCASTVAPLAALTGLKVTETAAISQDAYDEGEDHVDDVIRKRIERRVGAVLCSHGPVLPEILRELARATRSPIDSQVRLAGMLRTGSFSVVHVPREDPTRGIVAVEVHGPAA